MLLGLYWFFSSVAVLLGLFSLRAGSRHLRSVLAGMKAAPEQWTPPVTLIVPVKGREEGLAENLRSLAAQDYPDFELLVTVRDPTDPALESIPPAARLIVAGPEPPRTSEKIGNLLAAVAQARAASKVLAFADSDGRVETGWLRALVAPLTDPAAGAATGYRWYFPERTGFWPLMRSVWNSTIAGAFGTGREPFAWGGAMALRRETFQSTRVADFWLGSISDDYRLTQAVRAAGLQIRFTPRAMVSSAGECTAARFLAWAIRQMTITRTCAPRLWWLGFAAHIVYCAAMAAGALMILAGRWWSLPILLLAVVPGWRGELRRRAARLMFPGHAPWLDRHGWIYAWLTPAATWIWLYVFLASLFQRKIEWRGRVYDL
ncbi:MAG: glycosyltransferase [Acidobacteria bacterium]|nr:glycosyltransferase [Acidobacteriota bacterium]